MDSFHGIKYFRSARLYEWETCGASQYILTEEKGGMTHRILPSVKDFRSPLVGEQDLANDEIFGFRHFALLGG